MKRLDLIGAALVGLMTTAQAATEADLKAAFAKAQKKGAVAVVEERCGGPSTVYFPGSTKESLLKTSAALAAMAATRPQGSDPACEGGMRTGDIQVLELYPDGTVKAH
jgi:hypothetical protein